MQRRALIIVLLLSALIGGIAVGIFGDSLGFLPQGRNHHKDASSNSPSPDAATNTVSSAQESPSSSAQTPPNPAEATPVAPFIDAAAGACITWIPGMNGEPNTQFSVVDCAQPHRFEVSSTENLADYPSSEFGATAPVPSSERLSQLNQELCEAPTYAYLQGKLDPSGRYSVVPILAPAAKWAAGDRTLLCGVMVQDATGRSLETTGRTVEQDQAQSFPVGTCIRVDAPNNSLVPVPCEENHNWEVTAQINLSTFFPHSWPTKDQQNRQLSDTCTKAAQDYLGGDDSLYNSTLVPFWTTIGEESWFTGSHTVNCALTKGNPQGAGFATLTGSAKGKFLINGSAPPPQPTRHPLRR